MAIEVSLQAETDLRNMNSYLRKDYGKRGVEYYKEDIDFFIGYDFNRFSSPYFSSGKQYKVRDREVFVASGGRKPTNFYYIHLEHAILLLHVSNHSLSTTNVENAIDHGAHGVRSTFSLIDCKNF